MDVRGFLSALMRRKHPLVTSESADIILRDMQRLGYPFVSVLAGDQPFPVPQEVAENLDLREGQKVNKAQVDAICRASEFWLEMERDLLKRV